MTRQMLRISWVNPDATDGVEVLPQVQALMLVGQLIAMGVQVIGIHDHATWLMLDADRAELDALAKSPQA